MKTLFKIIAVLTVGLFAMNIIAAEVDPPLAQCSAYAQTNDIAQYVATHQNAANSCYCAFSESWNGCKANTACNIAYGSRTNGMAGFYKFIITQTNSSVTNPTACGAHTDCQIYFSYISPLISNFQVNYEGQNYVVSHGASCDWKAATTPA